MLLTALFTVITLWLSGHAMDALLGPKRFRGRSQPNTQSFNRLDSNTGSILNQQSMTSAQGVYLTAQRFKLDAFNRLIAAASQFNFGLGGITRTHSNHYDRTTVVGAMRDMAVTLPGWLWRYHRGFFISYGVDRIADLGSAGRSDVADGGDARDPQRTDLGQPSTGLCQIHGGYGLYSPR